MSTLSIIANFYSLVVVVGLRYIVRARFTLQPVKIKPKKIWEDCLLLCSWLTRSRLNPKVRKTPSCFFVFCMPCLVDMNPSILFSMAWPLSATVLLSCQSFLVTDGVSHEARGETREEEGEEWP